MWSTKNSQVVLTGVNYNSEAADSCYNSEQQLDRNSTNSSADDISDR
jgi:hypothetical protein